MATRKGAISTKDYRLYITLNKFLYILCVCALVHAHTHKRERKKGAFLVSGWVFFLPLLRSQDCVFITSGPCIITGSGYAIKKIIKLPSYLDVKIK